MYGESIELILQENYEAELIKLRRKDSLSY